MNNIRVCDSTVRKLSSGKDNVLSFKEKLEVAKLLDKLCVDVIELDEIRNSRVDSLLIKSVSTAVKNSTIAVPVALGGDPAPTAAALSEAGSFRLQVVAPGSSVRMEYVYHKKAPAITEMVKTTIGACREYTDDVELLIDDATRADGAVLSELVKTAADAGATTITFCDDAGTMLPEEFAAFLEERLRSDEVLENMAWGVSCSDELSMADACVIAALCHGAKEIKASAYPVNTASLENVCRVIAGKGESFGVRTGVATSSMKRTVSVINRFCVPSEGSRTVFGFTGSVESSDDRLTSHDSKEAVTGVAEKLGYSLSDEDAQKVYEAFMKIASKKESVSAKELDAIVAVAAMQVPARYVLENYIVNTGSSITAMAHVSLQTKEGTLEGVSLGDGPIDAAFHAIEQITGRRYELDDFQIKAVTEGKEAAAETIVKLLANGRVYSGRGLSTDIIGASVRAYLNAVNKVVFEEEAE
ncbi:MAG: hypothetical protein K6E49_10310 [Lachnospiraceae bacterium]|nr:hypothetical protein [Lachnospiraceae bacterium]